MPSFACVVLTSNRLALVTSTFPRTVSWLASSAPVNRLEAVKVWLAFSKATFAESRASATVPAVRLVAFW